MSCSESERVVEMKRMGERVCESLSAGRKEEDWIWVLAEALGSDLDPLAHQLKIRCSVA